MWHFVFLATRSPCGLEVGVWTDAASVLSRLSTQISSSDSNDVVGRVNRLISAWPTDDTMPAEGFESLKGIYTKLNKGLTEIKMNAERDAKLVSLLYSPNLSRA